LRGALVAAQALTFVGLGLLLVLAGEWRLAGAQLLLAIVTGLVYA
jgi:hypothetical protein